MIRRFSIDFAIVFMLLDGLIVCVSLVISVLIRPYLNSISLVADVLVPYSIPWLVYPLFSIIWVIVLLSLSAYDPRRHLQLFSEISSFTLGSIIAGVSLAGMLYFSYRDVSRIFFLLFFILTYCSQFVLRLIIRRTGLSRRVNGQNHRKVLIAGSGVVGLQVEKQLVQYGGLGLDFAGFLDDDPQERMEGGRVLGTLDQARQIIEQYKIEDVVLALPSWAHDRICQLVADLHDLPVKVWVVPDYFTLALNRASVEELAGIPMIDLRAPAIGEDARMLKRFFDIMVSFLLLPVALPIMGILVLAIRIDSPGPAIFRQKRVGENGRIFNMYKFRSMILGAEKQCAVIERVGEDGRIVQDKTLPDSRITRVGTFIRRTSLDELPQLFNVLKGDMSLVGPRPELPYLVDKYEPWQRKRFGVPQGMTGWWQINGRSDKPMYLHTEEDLYYVQNYSLWIDLQILFKTVLAVISRKGAY